MFTVKICGITTVEDAQMVAAAGADAIGLNFCEKSPRLVSPHQARRIVESLPPAVVKVGLFVNGAVNGVLDMYDGLGLNLIQLHGDEPPQYIAQLGGRRVMRAFRMRQSGLTPVVNYLQECRELACMPAMVLIDSYRKDQYGGTGEVADWSQLSGYPAGDWHPPMILAGGLTAENVAEAIQTARPRGVDTASGVESSPGHKDPAKVRRFVAAARAALEGL